MPNNQLAPPDPFEKALILRTKQAGVEKAEAEALTAKVTAQRSLFNTDLKKVGMTGEITVGAQTVAGNILVRSALSEAANAMAGQVAAALKTGEKKDGLIMILYDKASLDLLSVYSVVSDQLTVLDISFRSQISTCETIISTAQGLIREATPPTPNGAQPQAANPLLQLAIPAITPLAILGVTKTIAEIADFFKTNTTITTEEVAVSPADFVTVLFEALRRNNELTDEYATLRFYCPAIVAPAMPVTLSLTKRYTTLAESAEVTRSLLDRLGKIVTELQTLLAIDPTNSRLAELLEKSEEIGKMQTSIRGLIAVFDALSKQLTESTATASVLSQLVRVEPLKQLLGQPNVFQVKVDLATKAERRVRRWVWSNDRLEYAAGVWASASFFDAQGALWRSFQTVIHKPYTKTDSIKVS